MSSQILCVVKVGYKPVVNANDPLPITNLGALRFGLEALRKEDAEDYARAKELWKDAKDLLITESEDDTGAGATGKVQVEDDFELGRIGDEHGWGGDCE